MNKLVTHIALLLITLAIPAGLKGQCTAGLVEELVPASGKDALVLDTFTIKNLRKRRKPVATEKFPVILNQDMVYRFNVASNKGYKGKAILQLYDRGRLLGSTYKIETGAYGQSFDFHCQVTGHYQVLLSIDQGLKGCASGIMSLLVTDSIQFKNTIYDKDTRVQTLYIGVDNPLDITVTELENGTIEVSIDQGKIIKSEAGYIARVNNKGQALLTVIARDSTGKISEIANLDFMVLEKPVPYVMIANQKGGAISKPDLLKAGKLEINYPFATDEKLTIRRFEIGRYNRDINGIGTIGNTVSLVQKSFIQSLEPGSIFSIYNIEAINSKGEKIMLEPLSFTLE